MATILGKKCKLYRITRPSGTPVYNLVANVKDVTVSVEEGDVDVSTRADGDWETTVGSLKKASVDFKMVEDPDDSEFIAFSGAFFDGPNEIEIAALTGAYDAPGTRGFHAVCRVTKFSQGQPLGGAVENDVSLKPTRSTIAPEWMVVE